MALTAVILSCAFSSLDDRLLAGVAMRESEASPFYVRGLGQTAGIDHRDEAGASDAISRLTERTGGAYVGVMGVPTAMSAEYDWPPATLLNPCENVRLATTMLGAFQAECEADGEADLAGCTLRRYGEATGYDGASFADAILLSVLTDPVKPGESTAAEGLSERLLLKTDASDPDSVFFDLDLTDLNNESHTRIAEDLEGNAQ